MGAGETIAAIGGVGALGFGAYYMYKKGMFDDLFEGDGNGGKNTVELTVKDEYSDLVKNQDVVLYSTGGLFGSSEKHTGTTDDEGKVSWDGVSDGTFVLGKPPDEPKYGAEVEIDGDTVKDVTLEPISGERKYPAEVELNLHIVDANDNPMKNTKVTLWVGADWHDRNTDSNGDATFKFDVTGTDEEITEIDKLEVEVAPDTQGEFTKEIEFENIKDEWMEDGVADRTIQSTQSTLEIQVLSESSEAPIADVGVEVSGESDAGDEITESRDTSGEGYATFVAIPKGTYDVTIITDDGTYKHTVTTPTDEVITYKIRVKSSTTINYELESGSDFHDDVEISIDGAVSQSKPVGDDLSAEFINIPEGMYSVTVSGPHIKDITKDMKLAGEEKTITTEILTYELYVETIAKETGDYLQGVQVKLTNDSSYGPQFEKIISTNEDGLATFPNVPANTLTRVKASIEGEEIYSKQLDKPAPDTTKEISLEIEGYCKTGTIQVVVDNPEGNAASGKAGLTDYNVGADGIDWVSLDSNGIANIEDVPVGTHTVTTKLDGGIVAKTENKDVEVEHNKTKRVKFESEYAEGESGTIKVTTDDRADGTPVELYYDGQKKGEKQLSNGTVKWEDMRPNTGTTKTYVVRMVFEGTKYSEEFMLDEGETVNIEFTLQAPGTGTFVAIVKDENTLSTIPNVDVIISKMINGSEYRRTKQTNSDGEAVFTDVPAVEDINVAAGANTDFVTDDAMKVSVGEDQETVETFKLQYTVDRFNLTINARSGKSDEPIPTFSVRAVDSGNTYTAGGSNGKAVLRLPPGTYEVTATAQYFYPSTRTIELAGHTTTTMYLKFEGGARPIPIK